MPPVPPAPLLADGLQPSSQPIRAFLSPGRIFGQYLGTALALLFGLAALVCFILFLPLPLSLLAGIAALVGCAAIAFLATHNDYRWIELDGRTLRARHLYTGRTVERTVDEIDSLYTMLYEGHSVEVLVIKKLLGAVKGVEVRFRDQRTPLRIVRKDPAMTNAQELIEAILCQMTRFGPLDIQLTDSDRQPFIRSIGWQGQAPAAPRTKLPKVLAFGVISMGLLFGAILAFQARQDQERLRIASVPPHEMTLRDLIQHGPGPNRHVTLTNFRPGGYASESRNGLWTHVWIVLFPAPPLPADPPEIQLVLSSTTLANDAALQQLLQPGKVTGICSPAPQANWGATLGPNLRKANPGQQLSSAWSFEELRTPPTPARITQLFWISAACFTAALIAALLIFWKAGS